MAISWNIHTVLVVDSSAIANVSFRVEQEYLRRSFGTKLVCDFVSNVLQHSELKTVPPHVGSDLGHVILTIRVDPDDHKALVFVFVRNRLQTTSVELYQGTFGAKECEDDQLFVLDVGKLKLLASLVL